jgi:hypothetical protein
MMAIFILLGLSWCLGWWTAFVMLNKEWKKDMKVALFGWIIKKIGKLD